MLITLEILKKKEACQAGLDYFQTLDKQEWEVMELVERVHKDKKNFSEWLFIKFKLTGLCKVFYDSSEAWHEVDYSDGKRHGLCKGFDESGQVKYECSYEDHKLHGFSTLFYRNAQFKWKSLYENNVLISEQPVFD